jgi:N-acyl-D-aspartate/D-glutamate deacylase
VIRGGLVVDGTGAPGRRGDVAVRDGRLAEVGSVSGRGKPEGEADGLIVAPGFMAEGGRGPGRVLRAS